MFHSEIFEGASDCSFAFIAVLLKCYLATCSKLTITKIPNLGVKYRCLRTFFGADRNYLGDELSFNDWLNGDVVSDWLNIGISDDTISFWNVACGISTRVVIVWVVLVVWVVLANTDCVSSNEDSSGGESLHW